MAQLKDLIVNGPSQFIGDAIANTIQIDKLKAKSNEFNNETYTEGSNGDILMSQNGHLYWKTPIATNGDLGFVKIGTGISSDLDGTINVTPADLGLASAMHFRGITTTDLKDSSTSPTIVLKIGNSSTTAYSATAGDVVLYSTTAGTGEYVWTGDSWELLGDPNSFKVKQQAVTTATSGDLGERRFVSSITQNENGEISISTSPLALANEDSSGAIKTGFSTTGQLYAVELSPTGAAYVNVPWKNTTPYGVRVYRQITSDTSWNNDYPLLVSRTTANNIGEIGNDGTYLNNVYGIINNDNTKIPTLNPHTGLIKISGGINLSGGMNLVGGQIKKQGESTSWHKGRDKAALAITQLNGYSVLASMSTTNGSWDIGAYNSDNFTDDLLFTYVTNTQYGGTAPNKTAQIKFLENGHIVADLDGSAEKIKITTTSLPDSGSNTYYLTYVSGTSGNQALKSSTRSYVWENKDSTYGCLGNSGILGAITLYSRSTSSNGTGYYGNLKPPSTLTNSVNWTLPDKDGTIALFENTWSLSGGTAILSAANLNSVTAPGNYYCNTNSNSKTILNNPYSTTANDSFHAFTLKVIHSTGNSATHLRQEVWEYDKNYYFIRRSTTAGVSWTPWVKFDNESSFVKRNGSTAIGSTATPIFVDSNGVANSVSANNVLINLGTTASDSIYKGAPRPGVTGILPVANGGTGAKTFTANSVIMSGNTTTAPLTTRAITNNTSNVTATANTNILTMNTLYYTLAKINYKDQTHATNIYAPTTAGTANQILVSSGGTAAPVWKATTKGAAYVTTTNGALTFGTLGVGYGGTGKTGWPTNSVLYASASATLGAITAPTKDSALKVGAANSAPIFTSISPSVTIGAGSANTAPTIKISVLGVEGTAKELTKSTIGVYGVTKLTETYSNTDNTLAITGKGVKNALDNTYWANVKVSNSSSPDTTEPIFKNAWAGSATATAERDIGAISQNGKIYFYSNGAANGKRGIWLTDKNGSNGAGLLIANADNEITTHAIMHTGLHFRGDYNKNVIPSDDIYQGIYFRDSVSTTTNYMTGIRTRKDPNGNQHLQFMVSKHGTGKEGVSWGTYATMSYTYPAAEDGIPSLTLPGRYISTVSSSTTKNDWSGIQFSVKDTTTDKTEYAYIRAYNSHTTNANGANLALNAASGILIGAGEGAAQVRDYIFSEEPNDIENIRLVADDSIHIYGGASNDEISGNKNTRTGIVINSSGNILPQKAGSSNDNQQNLGNNQNHFHNIYGNALYMTDNSQSTTRNTAQAFGMYQSGKELWFTRREYNSTASNVYVGAPMKFNLESGEVYIGITETNATSKTTYYPIFADEKAGTKIVRGSSRFYLYDYGTTNNGVWLNVGTSNYKGGVTLHSNNTHFGSMSVTASLSGDRSYILPDKTGWVPIASMAGAGSVTAPVYVSSTGSVVQVSANSVLTNLGSNSGASIYAATPRPGVTGILAIANGGTGANTAAKALDTDHLLAGINSNNLTTTLTDETIILSSSTTGFTSDYKGLYQRKLSKVKDYIQNNTYWANVKVSNSSSTSTKPTFAEATATTFHGALDGNASSATKIKITATELPSSGSKVYYLTYTSGTSGNQDLKNSGRSYIWEDQESVYASFGKAGILGAITLYSKSTSSNNASLYGNLRPTTTFTGRRTWYLPNATGWVVVGGNGSTTGVGSVSHPVYIDTNGVAKAVTLQSTQDALINSLPIGTDTPSDADYYVCQYANGGTANTAYRRRPTSALYTYIKGKIATDHLYVKRAGDTMTAKLTIDHQDSDSYSRLQLGSSSTASKPGQLTIFSPDHVRHNLHSTLTTTAAGTNAYRTVFLQNYAGTQYLIHGGSADAIGGSALPVYIAANGRATKITHLHLDATSTTEARYAKVSNNNGSVSVYVGTNRGVYDHTSDNWIINMRGGDNNNIYIPKTLVLTKTQDASATQDLGPALIVGGSRTSAHMELDANEIIAKSSATTAANLWLNGEARVTGDGKVYGAVYNDYAEMRNVPEAQNENNPLKPGTCVREVGDGTMVATTERLQRGCKIISDTFGFNIGETDNCKTPIAVSGRALVYLNQDREIARDYIGWPVCSGPNGTVSIMTEEEEEKYPSRIVGTISEIPDYEKWGSSEVEVNGRIWIYVR